MTFNEFAIKMQLDCYKDNNCIEDMYTKLFTGIIIRGWYSLSEIKNTILNHCSSEDEALLKIIMIANKFAIQYTRDETPSMRPHEYLIKIRDSGELSSEVKTVCNIK